MQTLETIMKCLQQISKERKKKYLKKIKKYICIKKSFESGFCYERVLYKRILIRG